MSRSEGIILAPLDPFFKPTPTMFQAACKLMLSAGLIEVKHNHKEYTHFLKDIRLENIDLFPDNMSIPEPSQWTQSTIEVYKRIFECETWDNYYLDEDKLRLEREYLPIQHFASEDFALDFHEMGKLDQYLLARYFWPGLSAAENVARFKAESTFYKVLKPGLEEIFATPVDVFVCVDL